MTRRVLLIIENVSFARDHRARKQVGTLLAAGYRVGVVTRRDAENPRYRAAGLRIYEYPAPPERGGKAFFALEYAYSLLAAIILMLRAVADGRFQAIQAGHPPDIYFIPAVPAKLLGVRFVVDQRDLSPEVYAARFGRREGFIPLVLGALERASWQIADHIICVNRSLSQVVGTRGGISPNDVTIVGNGPVLASVADRTAGRQLRERFRHLVCWVGVMGPQDHADLALMAIAHYVHRLGRRDALFVFIGDGEVLPALRRLARDLEVDDVVRFNGWLKEDEYFQYLAAADLGLDSNLQPEVTPVKGLQYMAHALPFVAFDVLETRALGKGAARYVEPGNAADMAREVARLLDAPEERGSIGRIGRERIEREFAWDRQEERYLALYERLIGNPRQVADDDSAPRRSQSRRRRLSPRRSRGAAPDCQPRA
jgi:glycosyltransferase involved in cell wall biosynthesis